MIRNFKTIHYPENLLNPVIMRSLTYFFVLIVGVAIFQSCAGAGANSVNGKIENAANLQVFLDQYSLSKANQVLAKAEIDGSGKFSMKLENGFTPGIYRLRIGAKKIFLIFSGKEKSIDLSGDLNTLENYVGTVSGSPASEEFFGVMKKVMNRELDAETAKTTIEGVKDPMAAMMLAYSIFGKSADWVDFLKSILPKLSESYPASEYVADYNNHILKLEGEKMMQQQSGPIAVGMEAPNISLQSPEGKNYSLADLKGKVVLLDFWASWCGPCRRENPNVVRVYDKYNSKGFEVFSVSLDRPNGKDAWVQAIKQDNLKWKYHVSDLQFWQSAPARLYGVNSIPRTFLIDKEGKIAAVNLRGAEAIERELQKLL